MRMQKIELHGGPHDGKHVHVKVGEEAVVFTKEKISHHYYLQDSGAFEYDGWSEDVRGEGLELSENDDGTFSLGGGSVPE